MKKKATIADLEKVSGKPDSIRKLSGKNARADLQISNYMKEFKERLQDLTLPDPMPTLIEVSFADGSLIVIEEDIDALKSAAALLNFGGHLS